MAIGLIGAGAPSARADLVNGACIFDVTITFSSAPTLTASSGYSISVSNTSCEIPTFGTATTSVGATSSATNLSRCGVLAGVGSWEQDWSGFVPLVELGSHVLVGTWLSATIVATGIPNNSAIRFTSIIKLVPRPGQPLANATAMASCAQNNPVSSIKFLGIQVFNDPVI